MNKKQLGKEVTELRKRKGLSQSQLAEGICTQSAISQIEKGLVYPKVDTLYYLASKLDTSLNQFVDILLEEDKSWQKEVQTIENLIAEQKHQEICSFIHNLNEREKHKGAWMSCFTAWAFSLSRFHCGKNSLKGTIRELKKLLHSADPLILRKNNLHIRLMNSIAFLHALNKEYAQSLYYYDRILETGEKEDAPGPETDPAVYRIRVMYNKAKTLYDMGETVKSLQIIEEGINVSLLKENMSLLGQMYYYQGQCFEKLQKEPEEIIQCYDRALFIFEILDKKLYSQLIWQQKSQYVSK